MSTSYSDPTGLAGLPILRLPIPENPNPEKEEPVRRRVAVKVIKLGMDTKQVIARF